jgi:hypothetical protein
MGGLSCGWWKGLVDAGCAQLHAGNASGCRQLVTQHFLAYFFAHVQQPWEANAHGCAIFGSQIGGRGPVPDLAAEHCYLQIEFVPSLDCWTYDGAMISMRVFPIAPWCGRSSDLDYSWLLLLVSNIWHASALDLIFQICLQPERTYLRLVPVEPSMTLVSFCHKTQEHKHVPTQAERCHWAAVWTCDSAKKAVLSQTTTCAILTLKLHLQFNLSHSMLTHGSHMKMAPSPRIHKKGRNCVCNVCHPHPIGLKSSLHTDQQITAVRWIKWAQQECWQQEISIIRAQRRPWDRYRWPSRQQCQRLTPCIARIRQNRTPARSYGT